MSGYRKFSKAQLNAISRAKTLSENRKMEIRIRFFLDNELKHMDVPWGGSFIQLANSITSDRGKRNNSFCSDAINLFEQNKYCPVDLRKKIIEFEDANGLAQVDVSDVMDRYHI